MNRNQKNRRPMTIEEHIRKADELRNDWPEAGDELLHDLFVGMYPMEDSQKA